MAWYVLRRLLQMIPVFLGATLLIYALVFLVPGDPIHALAGDKPMTPAVEAQLRARYHLDEPFLVQYLLFLKGIVTLDFERPSPAGRYGTNSRARSRSRSNWRCWPCSSSRSSASHSG